MLHAEAGHHDQDPRVIELLDGLRRKMGIAFIFIAHDLPVVRDLADHVMIMQRGRVVETGPVRQVFEAPREAYTRALLAAVPDPSLDHPLDFAAAAPRSVATSCAEVGRWLQSGAAGTRS